MSMVTVAQLRDYLSQVAAGAGVDEKLDDVIVRAEGIVTTALGFTFFDDGDDWSDVAASTVDHRSERSKYLKLRPYLYGSITSVRPVTGSGDERALGTAITNYDETESKFYLEREEGWGALRYAVTAKYGYGPAPAAIVEVVLELSTNIWRQKAQGMFQTIVGVSAVGQATGGGAIKYVGGINAEQRKIIKTVRAQFVDMVY
jgi:hypothetical protein